MVEPIVQGVQLLKLKIYYTAINEQLTRIVLIIYHGVEMKSVLVGSA